MKKGGKKAKKFIYGAASLALFLCLVLPFPQRRGQEEMRTAQIVVFGDSAYGNVRDESSIPEQLGRLLGKTVYNAAFGGTCASRNDRGRRLDYSGDSLSLPALTKAIWAEDFGIQQTIRPVQDVTYYFGDVVDGLERIDFSLVETVIIGYGLNDYTGGAPLENERDPMDEYTFAGALRKSLKTLKEINPSLRIVLVTPTYSWIITTRQTCEEFDGGGGILEDYVEKEIAVAAEMGVEVIDLYHDFFIHEEWEDRMLYTVDGLHPNEAGRALIAEKIAGYLEGEVK